MITTPEAALIAIANYLTDNAVPELYDKKQAAAKLNISEPTLNRLMESGELDYVKIGVLVRFKPGHLNRLINNGEKKTRCHQ